jgi:hypothetical protein
VYNQSGLGIGDRGGCSHDLPIKKRSEIFVYLKPGVSGALEKDGCRLCCLVAQLGRRSALGLPRWHLELQPWPPQGTQPSPYYASSQPHHQKKQSIRNPSEPHQNLIRTPSEPHDKPMKSKNVGTIRTSSEPHQNPIRTPSEPHHQFRAPSEPHQNLIRTPSEPHQNPMTICNRRVEASTDMMAILPNPFLRLWGPCHVFLAPRSG